MVPATRRHVLHGAAALGALLAGCNERETPSTAEEPDDVAENVHPDPENVMLRGARDSPIVELSTPTETTGRGGGRGQSNVRNGLIASRERADRLSIADVDGAGRARSFVDGTDFSSETLGVERSLVGECYRRELCHVVLSESEYETWFLETYRDAHVTCSERNDDNLVTLFRIPAALDPETTEHGGTGISRRGCREPRPADRRADE